MKVIVDNKIPYIREELGQIADEVVYLPGNAFTPELVKDADALIIRTRTSCNRALLEDSCVKFIATATIGYDHIDTLYCLEKGITWTNAPGCNAASVCQYVQSSLLLLQQQKGYNLANLCLGIVGVGNVGKKVQEMAELLGMKVLLNDPPRADKGEKGFTGLQTIARECDIITFHTPLNREGMYQTFQLANNDFFCSLQKKTVLINTSRGEIIETKALLNALKSERIAHVVIDVWENEPHLNFELLKKTFIGTPHIAGYSADGKANATRMSLESLCRFFDIRKKISVIPPSPTQTLIQAATAAEAYLEIYNPKNDSKALKDNPVCFESLRENYPLRRESKAYTIRLTQ